MEPFLGVAGSLQLTVGEEEGGRKYDKARKCSHSVLYVV